MPAPSLPCTAARAPSTADSDPAAVPSWPMPLIAANELRFFLSHVLVCCSVLRDLITQNYQQHGQIDNFISHSHSTLFLFQA
jgi:hypothetical protein